MQNKTIILFNFFLISQLAMPLSKKFDFPKLPLEQKQKEKLWKNTIFSESIVDDSTVKKKSIQKLDFYAVGLHSRKCRVALSKLSQYENYQKHVNAIEKSSYNGVNNMAHFTLSSPLLPFAMTLDFKIARIKKPGLYPFTFNSGLLKGLVGNIHVSEHQNRCLFFVTAKWQGKHSGIPNFALSLFTKTIAKISLEKLFQISKTY